MITLVVAMLRAMIPKHVIAGDAHATSVQSAGVTTWSCLPNGVQKVTIFPACRAGESVEARVEFPNCWDGVHLDSADYKSHVAYGGLSKVSS